MTILNIRLVDTVSLIDCTISQLTSQSSNDLITSKIVFTESQPLLAWP